MMTSFRIITVLVITLSLWGQTKSQSQGLPSGVVNGPTGISVEALEEQQQLAKSPPNVINGPTAYSVEAEELKKGDGLYREVEEDLLATNDDGSPRYIEADVDLENLAADDEERQVVNGPSGSSVQQEEQMANNRGVISTDPKENEKRKQIPKGYHMDTSDWSTDSPHWTFKAGEWEMVTLPDKEKHPTLPAPEVPGAALVVVTDEYLKKVYVSREVEGLSRVTLHYRFYLSEGEYPNGLPELKVYLVKDELHTHQLAFETTFGRWSDNTVEIPETEGKFKILFEGRLNKLGNEIAVDDITISGISGDNGGINATGNPADPPLKRGGEKDATTKNPDADKEADKNEDGTVKPDEEGEGKPEDSDKTTKNPQVVSEGAEDAQGSEKVTDEPDISGNVTTNLEETGVLQNSSDISLPGNNTVDVVEGTGVPVHDKETNITDSEDIIESVEKGNDTVSHAEGAQLADQGNQTFALNESLELTLGKEGEQETNNTDSTGSSDNATVNAGIHGGLNNSLEVSEVNSTVSAGNFSALNNSTDVPEVNTNVTTGISGVLSNFTEAPVANQTVGVNFTTDGNVTQGENVTHVVNATVSANVTGIPEHNITNSPNNATTMSPGAVTTEPSVNINQTVPAVSTNATNVTEAPANNGTGGGINSTSVYITTIGTTPEILNPLSNATTDQGISMNATTMPVIMINSTSPSGSNGSTPGNFSGIGGINGSEGSSSSGRSWGAFKIFLIICLLGVIVLGFLYWRRMRRRDDEIPVFSRSSQADYHNPTFSDDDANFAARGTGHNYKSFN